MFPFVLLSSSVATLNIILNVYLILLTIVLGAAILTAMSYDQIPLLYYILKGNPRKIIYWKKKIMERFNKKTMSIYSKEYDDLLNKEIGVWSKYSSGEATISEFAELKKTMPYQTYRKGTIEAELEYIKNAGENIDVLELGSADGWLTNEILKLKNVASVTSIDVSIHGNLKQKYNNKTHVFQGDLNKIDKINFGKKYHCIITHGTLHHLVDPKKTIEYCVDNLLADEGILIINDTWVLQSLQLKTNAFLYLLLNRVPHSIIDLDMTQFLNLLFIMIPSVILSKNSAGSVAHSHKSSPFESISSADDYKEAYSREDVDVIYFKNLGALSGLQNSWSKSPKMIKEVIQKMDNFLIDKKIFVGDFHICILKKHL